MNMFAKIKSHDVQLLVQRSSTFIEKENNTNLCDFEQRSAAERDFKPTMSPPEFKVNKNKSRRLSMSLNAWLRQMYLCGALSGSAGDFQ